MFWTCQGLFYFHKMFIFPGWDITEILRVLTQSLHHSSHLFFGLRQANISLCLSFFFSIVITVSSRDLPKTKVFKSYQVINVVSGMYATNIGSIISSLTSVSGLPAVFLSTLSFILTDCLW